MLITDLSQNLVPFLRIMDLGRQAMLIKGYKIIIDHYTFKSPLEICYKDGMIEYIDKMSDKTILPKAVEFFDSASGTDDEELLSYVDQTSINSDAYCIAVKPSPLRPKELSYCVSSYLPDAYNVIFTIYFQVNKNIVPLIIQIDR